MGVFLTVVDTGLGYLKNLKNLKNFELNGMKK